MTEVQQDATGNVVSRRKFMEGLGLTAAGASAGVVIGVAIPVGAESATVGAGDPTGGAWPIDQSIRPQLTAISQLHPAPDDEQHLSYAPALPSPIARSDQRIFDVHVESIEGDCPLDPANGITTEMWGFRIAGQSEVICGSPGPVFRGRVGDVVNITLTNMEGNSHPHNIDFHAVTGQGGGAADLTVNPGESATIQVRLLYPGAFMYHCAFGDVPVHIAHGMYGMFVVDPETPLPQVDHEWAIMQSEWYVGEPDAAGVAAFDRDSLVNEEPRFVTFNGHLGALTGDNTLTMNVGERARIYFVNQGLNLDSNFHAIGSHWDLVYPEAATHPSNRVIRGSQSTLVVAGGGTVVEVDALLPTTLLLVDHALVRTFYKGALGTIVVSGEPDPEIFGVLSAGGGAADHNDDHAADDDVASATEVVIPVGAFNPANAETAFDPLDLTIAVGTTVRWTNLDSLPHTVTSGPSDGTTGAADGLFDSGFLNPEDTFTYTFDEVGEYDYFCLPHPWMVGKVTVTEAAYPPAPGTEGGLIDQAPFVCPDIPPGVTTASPTPARSSQSLPPNLTTPDELATEASAIAEITGRPVEHVHVIYEPPGRGRVAFGGGLLR